MLKTYVHFYKVTPRFVHEPVFVREHVSCFFFDSWKYLIVYVTMENKIFRHKIYMLQQDVRNVFIAFRVPVAV